MVVSLYARQNAEPIAQLMHMTQTRPEQRTVRVAGLQQSGVVSITFGKTASSSRAR